MPRDADLAYLEGLHQKPSAVLLDLEREGLAAGIPIVERGLGYLLSTLTHCMQANRILEIGTAYGYSTLWMALAMPPAGHLWTFDPDRARTEIALGYFERAGVADKIEIINQPAAEVLENFAHRNLDIIFIDANKEQYPEYLDLAVPMLKRSGLLVADNLLWDGRAAATPTPGDEQSTIAIREFNRRFLHHPQLDATIVPLGDGVGIGARVD